MSKRKGIDPIPGQFASYEEAIEFWDTHDTTDYPDIFSSIDVETAFRARHYEVEIEPDVVRELQTRARRRGVTVGRVTNDLLRQQLGSTR